MRIVLSVPPSPHTRGGCHAQRPRAVAYMSLKELLMARPRKLPDDQRIASIRADLTLAEKTLVQQFASQAGLSEAEFTRRKVLSHAIPTRSQQHSKAALISEINRLGNQLSALGNLTNQIALYCHTGRRIPAEWDVLPSEIKALLQLVEQTLEKVLYDDGS